MDFTCSDNLAGVCSYPTSVISLNEHEWSLSEGIKYDISVEVLLSDDVESTKHLGPFQIVFEAFDSEHTRLVSYRRTAKVRATKPAAFTALMKRLMLFPFYLLGLLHDNDNTDVRIRVDFSEKLAQFTEQRAPTIFTVQLQNRLAEIDEGTLIVRAHFGLFRYVLVEWPLISSFLIASLTFSSGLTLLALFWLYRFLKLYSKYAQNNTSEAALQSDERRLFGRTSDGLYSRKSALNSKYDKDSRSGEHITEGSKANEEPSVMELLKNRATRKESGISSVKSKTTEMQQEVRLANPEGKLSSQNSGHSTDSMVMIESPLKENGPVEEEYDEGATEQEDEVPECPVLDDIPGWDVIPEESYLRRRNIHKHVDGS